jgi:drug/metabolite transporter (DMT)-like permease
LNRNLKDFFILHFIIILWGFTAILGLLIRLPPTALVFYRTLLASAGLLAIIFFFRLDLSIPRKDFFKLFATGIVIAGHWLLFFGSARVSTASVCLAGLATTSFWTSLIEPWMKGRRAEALELSFGLIVILGLYLIFHFEFNYAFGLGLSLGSAFLGALFMVINSKITHRHNQYVITFYEISAACAVTGIFLLALMMADPSLSSTSLLPSAPDWLYLTILAFVCTIYPFSVSVELMKRLSAFMVNLSVNLEPVYGIILAVIIFGDREKMNTGFYFGTGIILTSVIAYPLIKRYIVRKRQVRLEGKG